MSLGAIRISIRNSLGTRLFFYVLTGALVGLGGMSYLFYQVLESQARTEIRSHLSTQAALIDGQLSGVKQTVATALSTVKSVHNLKIQDAEAYKQLVFNLYESRPPIVMGVGVGQAPAQFASDRKYFLPYFFVDQQIPDQVGQTLPAPNQNTRYVDISLLEDYTQQSYYTASVDIGRQAWTEPYPWYGITMTTCTEPLYDSRHELLGFVGFDVSVTALSQQINLPVVGKDGYFAIVSQKGNLLAYPPDPKKAKNLETYKSIPELQDVWSKFSTSEAGLIR